MLPSNSSVLQLHQDQFLEEAAGRVVAVNDLASYGEYIYPEWFHAHDMHRFIAYYLEQVVRYLATGGKEGIENLMILTPPQHGKSVEVSNIFPSWTLGKLPNTRILMASYGADLATDNSREVRNIVVSPEFQAVFGKFGASEEPVQLSSDSRATSKWDLAKPHRGGMIATGVEGAFSGRAKGLVLLDDLIKDHRAAESQSVRDDTWDWLRSSVIPRARAMVLVMTHWHADDPAGRFMKLMIKNLKAKQWVIIVLPCEAFEKAEYAASFEEQRKRMLEGVYLPLKDPLDREPGEVLCPALLSKEEMLKIKATSDKYYFLSLYQQMPYAKEGNTFKRDWFAIVDQGPGANVWARMRAWDKAATAGGGARSASVKMSWGRDEFIYIEHVTADQLSSAERDAMMIKIGLEDYHNDGAFLIWHPQDPGSAGLDSAQAFNNLLADKGLVGTFDQVTGGKEYYAGMLATKAMSGRVRLVRGGWNDDFIDEMVAFPKGVFKDRVDAAGSAFNQLRQIVDQLKEAAEQEDDDLVFEERVQISPV